MDSLQRHIVDVPDFPRAGIIFRDISPLLRNHFAATTTALSALIRAEEWNDIDALVGIESRGFVLAAAMAERHGKGLVMARKQGKLPPPTVSANYDLEYGADALEVKAGCGSIFLVDDVLATGGTMRTAAELCTAAGYRVAGLIVLLDLNIVRNFRWGSLDVRAAIRYE